MARTVSNHTMFELPAKEVLRLAKLCIAEVEQARMRQLRIARIDAAEARTYILGIIPIRKYPTEQAIEASAEVRFAKGFLGGTLQTAKLLAAIATKLINTPDLPYEKKVMWLTASDYFELI